MIKLYVGHEVVLRKRFVKFGFQNNSTSCYFSNYYFISSKCVLLQRDKDGNYVYASNRDKCTVIDPNNLEVSVNILGCNNCDRKRDNENECDLKSDAPVIFLGVLDIQPIESFTRTTDLSLAISLVKDYNNSIDKENEFVYVDDIKYVNTIREIDDCIGKKKTRTINNGTEK